MQNQIVLPPLIIRPDSEFPNPPGPIRDLTRPLPWNGTIIEIAAIEVFLKRRILHMRGARSR
jgi:hypothetical protein